MLSPSLVIAEINFERYSVTEYSVGGLPTLHPNTDKDVPLSNLTEVYSGALPNQFKPLDTELSFEFTGQISVAEAISKVLERIGYSLKVSGVGIDPFARFLYENDLPKIHRNFNNCSVIEIIEALVGESYTVVIDHRIRTISVDVSPEKARILSMELRSKRQYGKRKEVGNDM